MAKLNAWPRLATLRQLTVGGSYCNLGDSDTTLEDFMHELCRPDAAAARGCLLNVDTLILEDCLVSPSAALAFPTVFPKLCDAPREGGGRKGSSRTNPTSQAASSRLRIEVGSTSEEAMGILAARLAVSELDLFSTLFEEDGSSDSSSSSESDTIKENGDAFVQALARFSSLLTLKTDLDFGICSLRPLSETLSKLESLILSSQGTVQGLEEVLERLPLKNFILTDIVFPSPAPRLKSATLRLLEFDVNSSYPVLCPQDFPQLQVLQLQGIALYESNHEMYVATEKEQLQKLEGIILSLSDFPLSVLTIPAKGSNYFAGKELMLLRTFSIEFCSAGPLPPSSSSSAYLDLLKLLSPLYPLMKGVEKLCINGFRFGQQGMHITATVFPGLVEMWMSGFPKKGAAYTGREVCDAVLMMPGLLQMHLNVFHHLTDVISCLVTALTSGRPLHLDLRIDPHSDGSAERSLLDMKKQWDDVRKRLPAARGVVLDVKEAAKD